MDREFIIHCILDSTRASGYVNGFVKGQQEGAKRGFIYGTLSAIGVAAIAAGSYITYNKLKGNN